MENNYIDRVKSMVLKINPIYQTDNHINPIFRISSFILANIIVCYGLLTTKTIYGQMFWQIMNQTYNVGFNYANKSNYNSISNNDMIKMYSFAVVSSSIVSGLVSNSFKNAFSNNHSHFIHTLARGVIPFTSIFLSSTFNLFYVRKNDLEKGIIVYDEQNNLIDRSKIAAYNSFIDTASCRTVFRFFSCMTPPIIEYYLLKYLHVNQYLKIHTNIWMATRLSIISTCLYISMPLSFSIFPNTIETDGKKLENNFHNYKKIYYDRGL